MNTRLACVSAACVDAFVGEIWPEVFLERNLVTLSNHIYSIRSSYSCQMEVCSMGDLWWANSHAWGLGIWGRFWARYSLAYLHQGTPYSVSQPLEFSWNLTECDLLGEWRDCWLKTFLVCVSLKPSKLGPVVEISALTAALAGMVFA